MTDIPIIFSAPMVRALLGGHKTMTRRLAGSWRKVHDPVEKGKWLTGFRPTSWQRVKAGDRLWVRENLHKRTEHPHKVEWERSATDCLITMHRSNPSVSAMIAWAHHQERERVPSIHMPRWASRLTLGITATKIERLQDITNEEAELEGVKCDMSVRGFRDHFAELWKRLHGPESWDENPEVVALTFTVHKQNIDALPKSAAA